MRGMLNQSPLSRRLGRSCIKKDSCKEGDSSPTTTKEWKSMSNSTSLILRRVKDRIRQKVSFRRLKSALDLLNWSLTQHQRWSCHSLSMSETDLARFSIRSRRLERANLALLTKSLRSKMALFGPLNSRKRSTSEWETVIWDAKKLQRPFRFALSTNRSWTCRCRLTANTVSASRKLGKSGAISTFAANCASAGT